MGDGHQPGPAGREPRLVLEGLAVLSLQVSPSGGWLALEVAPWSLRVAPLSGAGRELLAPRCWGYRWAPEADRLAYATPEGIRIWSPAAGEPRLLAATEGATGPAWVPGAEAIVFARASGLFWYGLESARVWPLPVEIQW